jgi:hypothetical protein
MLKLYFPFFLYGFFIFYVTMFMWGFSAGPANIYPYISMFSSLLLFVVASTLSLYKVQSAAILGLVCLLATTPMYFNMAKAIGFTSGYFTLLLVVSLIMFAIGFVTSIKAVAKSARVELIRKPVKIVLSVIPPALITWWILAVYVLR